MLVDPYAGLARGMLTGTALDHVIFGRPAPQSLAREAAALGKQRVFLLSSPSLSASDGLPAQIAAALGDRHAGTFTGIGPHAPRASVIAGARAARAAGADLLVSVGGGSVSDATKYMLLCLWEGLEEESDLDKHLREMRDVPDPSKRPAGWEGMIRMFAVPTMLSAGEFTWFAGVTDSARRAKDVSFHPLYIPQVVVLDPAATLPTPVSRLKSSGMKAVEHAVEFLCSPSLNPIAEAVAGKAFALLLDSLPKLGGADDGLALRMDCQFGSWCSIYPSAAGVSAGGSHAIGHVLGPLGVAHGDTSGIVLPGMLRWNEAINSPTQRKVAALAGRAGENLADIVEGLARRLGLPTRLAEVGIAREQFDEIADKSLEDPLISRNPRPITGREDVLEILNLNW